MASKPRADAKLKTLPDPVQEQLFELYRKKSVSDCLDWLIDKHGVESSAGALSEFYSWYPLSRPLEQSKKFADEFKAALAANPELRLDAEQLSIAGQIAFEQQALAKGDVAAFVQLRKLRQAEKTFELEKEKFREVVKSAVEKGLDALQAEIKGNAAALKLFEQLKASVLKDVEEAA